MIRPARPLLAMVLAAAALACGEDRSAPSSPTPPVSEPNRETSALSILGAPASLHIGQTAQLRAMAQYVDGGGYVDVTQQATWQSSNEQACRVSAGMLTSAAAGVATVTAQFGGRSATVDVVSGYVITARVHENPPTLDVMLPDARVEVVGGSLDGRVFLTDAQGRVTLPSVDRAGFWLYFKKRGYDDLRFEIFELPRQSQLDISLLREPEIRVEFSGACTGQGDVRDFDFSTEREARVRAAMRSESAWVSALVYTSPSSLPSLLFTVCSPAAGSCPAASERVALPGTHRLSVHAERLCATGATWSVILEHAR